MNSGRPDHFLWRYPWHYERPLNVYVSMCTCVYIHQPLCTTRLRHKINFIRNLTGLNSEFSFSKASCHTKVKDPNLSYYLPIAGGIMIGFITFPRIPVYSREPWKSDGVKREINGKNLVWFGLMAYQPL